MVGKFLLIFVGAAFIGATQSAPTDIAEKLLKYREICITRSGSDEGYHQIIASIQPAKVCFLSRLDVQQFQMDATQLSSGLRKPFFDMYCPKLNDSMDCFDDTLQGIAKCVGDDAEQVQTILKNMVNTMLNLACQSQGQLFFDIQKPEFKECIAYLKEYGIHECDVSDALRKTSISKFGEQQCRELDDVQECYKLKVDECNVPRLYDIFRAMFNVISKANDCQQFTRLSETLRNNTDGVICKNCLVF